MSPDSLFLVDEESVQIVQSGMLNPPAAGAVRCERKSRKIIPFCPMWRKKSVDIVGDLVNADIEKIWSRSERQVRQTT